MTPIQAFNHSDGTMVIMVTEQAQIDWLRRRGLPEEFLSIGEHHLTVEQWHKLYPTSLEVVEPIPIRFLN